ncbi:MAG TPA: hypothetical protein VMF52_18010 [Steroidobacteraceae bacterium]|nr:hypothetical protein [Steroidobacteraceae bacterium]
MTTRMVKRLDELAQATPPPRDLWPAISAAIEAEKAGAAPAPATRRFGWRPVGALAAAVALVTVGVMIGKAITPTVDVTTAQQSQSPDVIPAAFQRDENYRKQREQLVVEVQKRLASMPAAERDKVSASLATLRRSISEIEAALGRDPANALLQELLVSSCQEEMRALTAVREAGNQET